MLAQSEPDSPASVQGKVVRYGTTEPLSKAHVELSPADIGGLGDYDFNPTVLSFVKARGSTFTTITNEKGEFSFEKIPPGRYVLAAVRDGFVRSEYLQRGNSDQGATIEIGPGTLIKDVAIPMRRAPTISGVVRDERDTPISYVSVTALVVHYQPGGARTLRIVQIVDTNDRGEYRLFWLTPGEYYVAVDSGGAARHETLAPPQGKPNIPPPEIEYPRTYYPSSPVAADARSIRVTDAGDVGGIDIKLRHVPLPSIRGSIVNLPASYKADGIQLMLSPLILAEGGYSARYRSDSEGKFEIKGVAPGSYSIRVYAEDMAVAPARVEVGEKDVENVMLPAQPVLQIRGRVQIDGTSGPLPFDVAGVLVRFLGSAGMSERSYSPLLPTGAYDVFPGSAFPGDFQVSFQGLPPGYYVKRVMMGPKDVLESGAHIGIEPPPPIDIILGRNNGVLSGVVSDRDNKPVAGVVVVLIPAERLRGRADRYPRTATDQAGRFRISGAPPGDYTALAFEEIAPGSYYNPEFLNQYAFRGVKVTLSENIDTLADLKLIPAER